MKTTTTLVFRKPEVSLAGMVLVVLVTVQLLVPVLPLMLEVMTGIYEVDGGQLGSPRYSTTPLQVTIAPVVYRPDWLNTTICPSGIWLASMGVWAQPGMEIAIRNSREVIFTVLR